MQIMKLNTIQASLLLGLAAACLLPGTAGAQAAPSTPGSSTPGSSTPGSSTPGSSGSEDGMKPAGVFVRTDALLLQKEAGSRLVQYPFAGDPRLDVKVTLHEKDATVADALRALSAATHITLTAVGSELPSTHLCMFAADTPLRNVLDGMAHLHDWEWKALKDKSLELCTRPRANQWDYLRPHTVAEAERFADGRQFLSQFATCPPALQNALTDMHHNGVPFGSLPPQMQQTVQDMLATSPSDQIIPGTDIHISMPAAENSVIRLQGGGGTQEWGSEYYVDVFDGHTGVLVNFMEFNDPNEDTDEVVPVSAPKPPRWYGMSEDAASRQAIAKEDTRLHVPVSLDLQDVPLASCLRSLAAATDVSFAADTTSQWTPESGWAVARKSVKVSSRPLTETLDQLAVLYGKTWGETKSGVIVFHAAPEKPLASAANTP